MLSPRRRRCAHQLSLATAAGLASCLAGSPAAHGQQNPATPTVGLAASDAAGVSSFTAGFNKSGGGTNWSASSDGSLAAGSVPTAGYAYVVTGSDAATGVLRTPPTGTSYTFAGDSLTVLAYNGQANLNNTSTTVANPLDTSATLEIFGPSSGGQAITVNNLVLGNGGAVIAEASGPVTLIGQIDLLATGTTLDGYTTTVSGGIIDVNNSSGITVNSTLVGAGQLHLVSSVRGATSGSTITLNGLSGLNADGSYNFSGGVLVDSSVSKSTSGSHLFVNIASATTLGTGTFTVQSVNPSGTQLSNAPMIDNTSGSALSLPTNNAQQWNGNFTFTGTNSLNFGTGVATLGAVTTLTVSNNVLAVGGVNASAYGLTVTGSTPAGGALEVPTYASVNTGGTAGNLKVAVGGTLAFPAATNTPGQLAGYAASLVNNGQIANNTYYTGNVGIDTAGVAGGTYNMTSGLPAGTYGLNKLGAGTLKLAASNGFAGPAVITAGTLQMGDANALGTSGAISLGSAAGVLDLNGYSLTVQPTFGSSASIVTNTSATPSTLTLPQTASYLSGVNYRGTYTGNLSLVVAAPAVTSTTDTSIYEHITGTNTYTGTTTLQSGVLEVDSTTAIPTTPGSIFFSGGILFPGTSGQDFSAGFSQAPGQQYNIAQNATNTITFNSGLNSSGGTLTVGNTNQYLAGLGTVTLAAANYYSGATTVVQGTLQVTNPKGLAGTSGVTVATAGSIGNGAQLFPNSTAGTLSIGDASGTVGLAGGVAGGTPITLNLNGLGANYLSVQYSTGIPGVNKKYFYDGFAFYGALQGTATGAGVWAGNVVVPAAGGSISGGYNGAAGGGPLTVTGVISGSGPLALGLNAGSTTVLAGANTYTGETQINCSTGAATTVQLGANNVIPAVSGLNFESNFAYLAKANAQGTTFTYGTETFDLNRYGTSVAYVSNLNGAYTTNNNTPVSGGAFVGLTTPAAIVNSAAGTTATLTIAGDANGAFANGPTNDPSLAAVPTFSGAIAENASSGKVAFAMNVANRGGDPSTYTQVLSSSASNYSGGTQVLSGTLRANGARTLSGTTLVGSSTGLGTVVVSGSGVLAGTGGTGPIVVAAGGTVTAGSGATTSDTIGTLGSGTQAWNASGTYVAKVASDGSSNDRLIMTGLTITGPFTVNVMSLSSTSLSAGTTLVLATDTNASQGGVFSDAVTVGSLVLSTNTVSYSSGVAPSLAEVDLPNGGGEELILEAAPEPTSLLLLTAAAVPLTLGRRRYLRHRGA